MKICKTCLKTVQSVEPLSGLCDACREEIAGSHARNLLGTRKPQTDPYTLALERYFKRLKEAGYTSPGDDLHMLTGRATARSNVWQGFVKALLQNSRAIKPGEIAQIADGLVEMWDRRFGPDAVASEINNAAADIKPREPKP